MDIDTDLSRRRFLGACLAAALAPTLPGCGDDDLTGPDPDGPPWHLTVRPGSPTLDAPSGRTSLGLAGSRDGWLYVPSGYRPDRPAPLFVALHGYGGSAGNWVSYPDRGEERGMVVLAVDSRSATWDLLGDGFGPDVRFLNRALGHTFERCHIDPRRIALGGFSDGASYALSLGLVNPEVFGHLVAYSPGFTALPETVAARPRVFVSHGTHDPVIGIEASRGVIVPGLRERGYDVTFVEFDGGHGVPAEISSRALDWFEEAEG